MKLKISILMLLILFTKAISAQDLTQTLNAEQVLTLIRNYYPIVRQSNIGIEKTKAEILNARGNFDPMLNFYGSQKTYKDINYYEGFSSEIMIPTWYGVDVFAGANNLSGTQLDPTDSKGANSFLGVNIPLAKNLLIDKRRAALRQAKLFNSMAEVEKTLIINDLCMDAMESYWIWVKTYQTYKVVENNVKVNEKRFELVRKSFINGERPAIDTLESLTQLMSFQYQKNENWLAFQNAGLQLSAYLWISDNQPYQLPETVIPQSNWENETIIANFNLSLSNLLAVANQNHPNLKIYDFKIDVLEIEKKLKYQDLLPKIDFRYNFLTKGYGIQNTLIEAAPFQNNYQMGLKVSVPLLFSQGRANYKLAKLKIEDTKLDQSQKQLSITLKIKSYYNEFVNLKNQVGLQTKNYDNYRLLVRAEETRFANGESSLFLINSRENKALEALEKLIELKTKYYKSIYALQWSAGLLR